MNNRTYSKAGREGGFTLIELVIVLVVLGVLAAIALPRFLDITTQADEAALQAQAAALTSAGTANLASVRLGGTGVVVLDTSICADIVGNDDFPLSAPVPATMVVGGTAGEGCTLSLGNAEGATSVDWTLSVTGPLVP